MDSTIQLSNAVKEVINRYAQLKPSHGDIRLDTVFDDEQKRYALMQVGCDRIRLLNGQIETVHMSNYRFARFLQSMRSAVRVGARPYSITHSLLKVLSLCRSVASRLRGSNR